jgi:hypothetical protein
MPNIDPICTIQDKSRFMASLALAARTISSGDSIGDDEQRKSAVLDIMDVMAIIAADLQAIGNKMFDEREMAEGKRKTVRAE